MDPTNVGAIFRSAAALHMDAVLVTPTCCDPLSRRAVRVSMGTLFQIPWTFLGTDASQWPQPGLERLKELGFQTAAMGPGQHRPQHRGPPGSARRRSWPSSWGQRGRPGPPDHRPVRLHRVHPHGPGVDSLGTWRRPVLLPSGAPGP